MLAGLLGALVLAGALFVLRRRVDLRVGATAWGASAGQREKAVAGALLALFSVPLLPLFPWIGVRPTTYFGDALSHVHVARDIARHGLPHGWIDTYLAGFPFGHHYPPLGTLLLAGLLGLGFSNVSAAHLFGFSCTLAAPLALFFAGVRAGARPVFAAAGAAYVACVSPYNPFVGGYDAFFQLGLVSQVLALPLCIAFAAVVARGRALWPAPLGALAMAAHPQLTIATVVVVGIASLASANKDAVARSARGAAGAALFGLGLYGQGILSNRVPFGWPPDLGWRVTGFGLRRFDWWFLDGDLLDRGREVSVLTALAGAALITLALRTSRPAARAALAAAAAALTLSAVGPALSRLEPVGPALLAVVQPMRVLALVPPVAGALLVVALEETAPLLRAAFAGGAAPRVRPFAPWFFAGVAFVALAASIPDRARAASKLASEIAARASGRCEGAPPGYRADEIRGWLSTLRGGRLWFVDADGDALERCLVLDGVPVASSVPIGITGGLGSHVGLHWLAFHRLEPERQGSDRRAEALGIRHLLVTRAASASGWRTTRRAGAVELWTHDRPTDLVGVGCVAERWTGSDRSLREKLVAELKSAGGADRLLDPNRLIALEEGEGALVSRAVNDGGCDAMQASVRPTSREPGAFEAEVETRTQVDVVFRAAAFPTWKVWIDGRLAPRTERVAPGFVAARVPPGRHRVLAVVSPMPGYLAWIALAALGVALSSVLKTRHVFGAFERLKAPMGT